LPTSQDDIDISRADLETAADAAGHFGRNQARARAEKRIIDQLAGRGDLRRKDRKSHLKFRSPHTPRRSNFQ
jgi:hypothetical protein